MIQTKKDQKEWFAMVDPLFKEYDNDVKEFGFPDGIEVSHLSPKKIKALFEFMREYNSNAEKIKLNKFM